MYHNGFTGIADTDPLGLGISDDINSLSNCCRLKSNIKDLGYFNSIGGTALEVGIVKATNRDSRRLLYRYEIEGHVYYSEGHSMIHSEACSCKTNNSQKTEK